MEFYSDIKKWNSQVKELESIILSEIIRAQEGASNFYEDVNYYRDLTFKKNLIYKTIGLLKVRMFILWWLL